MDKVIWSEGMFLRPQHFQQFERFIEHQAISRQRYLIPYYWGFTKLEIDHSLLSLGKVAVVFAEGVFPDGSIFKINYDPAFPLVIQISKEQQNQTVFITIPPQIKGVVESDEEQQIKGVRYRLKHLDIRDSHGINNERIYPVSIGNLNSMLVAEDELEDQQISLPVARIADVAEDGSVALDKLFGAPALDVSVNSACISGISDLVTLMKDKSKQLAVNIESGNNNSAGTVVDLLMLKALNIWGTELDILAKQTPLHPYDLFKRLSCLISEISTYTLPERMTPLDNNYLHIDSCQLLLASIEQARVLVSTAFKSTAVALPIQRRKLGISVVGLPNTSMVDDAEFILAIKADLSTENIRKLVGNKLKAGGIDNIKDLVNLQLPGCVKELLPVTPRQIPYHSGMHYFRLLPDQEMKADIKRSNGIGLHVSGDVPGMELEFWVIPSDKSER